MQRATCLTKDDGSRLGDRQVIQPSARRHRNIVGLSWVLIKQGTEDLHRRV
jgi:hypothetical protein